MIANIRPLGTLPGGLLHDTVQWKETTMQKDACKFTGSHRYELSVTENCDHAVTRAEGLKQAVWLLGWFWLHCGQMRFSCLLC